MKTAKYFIILLLIPLLFQIAGLSFERAMYSNDPEYIYLVNALNIMEGKPVGHVDNPGTPVMWLNALILNMYHPFDPATEKDLVTSVIEDPDRYVSILRKVYIFLNAIVLFALGFAVYVHSKNIWLSLLLQITPFFSLNLLEHVWTKVSPEPLLFLVTNLMIITILVFYYDENRRKAKYVILFSLLAGLGLATKATFLPLIVIPLIILPGIKRKLIYIPAFVAGFVVFTIPAIPEYSQMFDWFYNLSTHSGVYGSGEKSIIDIDTYFTSFPVIIKANIIFSLILIASLIRIILAIIIPGVRKKIFGKVHFNILIALTLAMIFGVFMVAKHYHANHYLIPVLSLCGITLMFNMRLVEHVVRPALIYRILLPVFIVVMIVFLPLWHYADYRFKNFLYSSTNTEYKYMMDLLDNEYADFLRIYYYPGSLNKYSALKFGGAYSKNRNLIRIKKVYPGIFFYNLHDHNFYNWEARTELREIVLEHGKKIVMVGGPVQLPKKNRIIESGLPLETIYRGRTQALYQVDSSVLEFSGEERKPDISVFCSFEEISDDGQVFIKDGYSFRGVDQRSSNKSRSRQYSLCLDKRNAFSMEHYLNDARAGDTYRISIWRYSDTNEGHLVAASSPEAVFYLQENDFVKMDENGWQKIVLNFTVPDGLAGNKLKLYIWNSGKSNMYFDDLTIEKWNTISPDKE